MYRTIQLALKARIDTILRAQYSPSFTTDPSGLSITLDTSQTSTSTTVYALYSVASTQTPNYGLIDLNTDGGTSNDVDFQLGYTDASNITVSPSTWQAGQTTPILISGNNLGTAPTAYVDSPGNDITYSYTGMVNCSISANGHGPKRHNRHQRHRIRRPRLHRLHRLLPPGRQGLAQPPAPLYRTQLTRHGLQPRGAYPHVNNEFFQSVEMSSLGNDSCTRDLRAAPDVCDAGREASIPQD